MASSLRERILSKDNPRKLQREPVQMMGETVWAWELTGAQRDKAEASRFDSKGRLQLAGFRALVVTLGTRENGADGAHLVFDENDTQMYLAELPGAELDRVFAAILRLSGMSAGDEEAAKKNSSPTPGDASSSDSPTAAAGQASHGDSGASAPAS